MVERLILAVTMTLLLHLVLHLKTLPGHPGQSSSFAQDRMTAAQPSALSALRSMLKLGQD